MNAPLVSCPFPVITFGWVQQQTHPKVMTGNGQLTRDALIINDFLRNPHFSEDSDLALFFENGTKVKMSSKIKPPLSKYSLIDLDTLC